MARPDRWFQDQNGRLCIISRDLNSQRGLLVLSTPSYLDRRKTFDGLPVDWEAYFVDGTMAVAVG